MSIGGLGKAKRDSIRVLDTGRPEAGDRAGLAVTLDRALDTLWMAYQPIVDAATRNLFGYEALLRSSEPALPHPGAVLDAAERLGRLDDVGRTVRSKAPEPMGLLPPAPLLFVNLHASDLNDEMLGDAIGTAHLDRPSGRSGDHRACVARRGSRTHAPRVATAPGDGLPHRHR